MRAGNENKYLKPKEYIPACNQTPEQQEAFKMNFSGKKANAKGRKPQMKIKKINDKHQSLELFLLVWMEIVGERQASTRSLIRMD